MAAIRIAALADTASFINTFQTQLKAGRYSSKAELYEALEQKRLRVIGARKFKSFDSFRVVRRLYLAKQTNTAEA